MQKRIRAGSMMAVCAIMLAAGHLKYSEAQQALPRLTVEFLTGSAWGPEEGPETFGQHLEFRKDGTYLDRWVGPGGCFYTGTFAVSKGIAVLTNTGKQECVDKKAYVSRCVLQRAPDSPIYGIMLACGKNNVYYRHDSRVPAGSPVNIKGVSAITTGIRHGESTTELMFRERPATSARAYTIKFIGEDPVRAAKSLPKGVGFSVLARTRDKARVSGWENYWYYIHLEPGEMFSPESLRGWVYGEFIRFEGK